MTKTVLITGGGRGLARALAEAVARDGHRVIITVRDMTQPKIQLGVQLGRKILSALRMGDGFTHMEWFYGPKGLKFSEIASRPPGVCTWDLYCAANGIDLYREWALAVCYGKTAQRPSRQFAAGMIAVRPNRDGRISGYEGVDRIERELGPCIIDMHLPPVGARTQPVEAGFMANAWLRLRHPDYDTMRQIMDWIGNTLKVYAK